MRSNVEVVGHPLHPIVVTIAIGAFVSAFIFDIAALATNAPTWFEMSYWTLLIGVCAGIISAMTGLYDYMTLPMSDQARRVATIHLLLNLTFMALFIASLILKSFYAAAGLTPVPYGRTVTTFVLDIIGIVVLLASGWYGGEIVYRHGVAVLEEAAEELRAPFVGRTAMAGALGGERPAEPQQPQEPQESDDEMPD